MAAAAYTKLAAAMELPDLLERADDLRVLVGTPGWLLVQASVDQCRERLIDQLTNATVKPEQVPYLRGQIEALKAMRETADGILALAERRQAEAMRQTAQEAANA